MEFFIVNKQVTEIITNGERLDFDYRELLYQEFSIYITWNAIKHRWKWWKISKIIEWIYFIDSSDDKRFYLYILFTIIKNSMSFEDLYTYNDIIHEIFKSICIIYDLFNSDEQWDRSLIKAKL